MSCFPSGEEASGFLMKLLFRVTLLSRSLGNTSTNGPFSTAMLDYRKQMSDFQITK